MARSARGGWQRRVLRPWTSGWRCCGKLWKKITTGWTAFWPQCNPRKFEEAKRREEKAMSKLTLKTGGDTPLVVTRHFAAPPEAVYRAHTDPKLIQQWLLGPDGWTMPVCINQAVPGGKFRY